MQFHYIANEAQPSSSSRTLPAIDPSDGQPFDELQRGGRHLRIAKRVKSGQVFINNYGAGGRVELPFGGVKSSGHGREKGLGTLYGFTTLKTVAIRHG